MMRGNKPQPTALKILRGNPGRRKLPANEPQPPPLDGDPPAVVQGDPVALAEWRRIAPGLLATGHVTSTDRGTLIAYCLKYSHWLALEAAAREQPLTVTGAQDRIILNRTITAAHRACEIFLRAAAELGLTPTSRTRVSAKPPAPAVSKWKGVL